MTATRADVTVRDVGPRDGLQSVGIGLPTDQKVDLVRKLAAAGLRRIETGSFVSPRAVPQMADSAEVFTATRDLGAAREALVVDRQGARRALEAFPDALVVVVAASERFSEANVRMSIEGALAEAAEIVRLAGEHGVTVVADIATAFGCAYEGPVPEWRVAVVADHLAELGVDELTLADTTGMATPVDVARVVGAVRDRCPTATIGLHFHNTRGLGLANVWAGLDAGVRLFDSSVGGIGGCPYSPGASGNIATEDVVHLLEETGHSTGVDLTRLIDTAQGLERQLGFQLPGQVLRAGPRWAVGGGHVAANA